MSEFQTVAKVGEIPPGQGRAFEVNGVIVAVFNIDGQYSAINDCCPHQGGPLSEGEVEGDAVYCPWHAWRFNVKDGRWLDNPTSKLRVETFETRVEGNEIQVHVPD